jgi:putative peptidoglycan lipid II flippase
MGVPLVVALVRGGIALRPRLAWRHSAVAKVARLSGWTVGHVAVNQAALSVTLVLANAHTGGVAAYQAAFIFFQLPHGLLAVSLMTTITPELSRLALRDEWASYRARFSGGLRLLWLVVVPATAGYLLLARPIVASLLQRGAFTAGSTTPVAQLVVAFAGGVPGFSTYLYTLRASTPWPTPAHPSCSTPSRTRSTSSSPSHSSTSSGSSA